MAESEKGEVKDTSIKHEIREDLINTAVRFLLTPKIHKSPDNLKKKFLLNKGLTEIEIDIAFSRAGLSINQEPQFNRHVAINLPPHAQLWQPQPRSMWHWIRDVANTITVLGGLFYAVFWVWKNYIYPYLFGSSIPKKKSIETSIADLEQTVETSVTDLKTKLQTVTNALDVLAEQRTAELTNGVLGSRIQEVKSEVASLKGLLLNRSQFPPTPISTGPASIPSWQLQESLKETESREDEGSGSEGTANNGSDSSSLEMIKE